MASSASHVLKIVIEVMDKSASSLKNIEKSVGNVGKKLDEADKKARTFDMRLLSLMFGGMALQKAFGGINRAIFDTFLKAEDSSSGLALATTRLSASWEFLKFSIMDALNNDIFIAVIDNLVKFINWMSQLGDSAKISFLVITTGLFLVGTGMMLIGQFKLGWDAIFGIGGFLNSTNTIHAATLGSSGVFTALKNFAIAGIAIKALFDIDGYLKGETDFRTLIDKLGTDISLLGLVTGNPWMIAIGVSFKLLKFGESLRKAGQTLTETGLNRAQEAFFNADETQGKPGEAAKNVGNLLFGGAQAVGGMALSGLGIPFEALNDAIFGADEQANTLSSTMTKKIIPDSKAVIETMSGKKQSLVKSLQDTGKAMDNVSTKKTEGFINSSNTRIDQMDKEITKFDEMRQAYNDALSAFETSVASYKEKSPVSD